MKALTSGGRQTRRAPTIYAVAERAGVSIATVSRVQRGTEQVAAPTRDRVERAIEELAYRPSRLGRSLAHGSHDATGIVFPDLSGPYYSSVILGYEEAAAADGRSTLILATHRRDRSGDQVLELADRVDGLVIMGRTVGDEVIEGLDRRGVPVVVLARPPADGADSVRAENVRTPPSSSTISSATATSASRSSAIPRRRPMPANAGKGSSPRTTPRAVRRRSPRRRAASARPMGAMRPRLCSPDLTGRPRSWPPTTRSPWASSKPPGIAGCASPTTLPSPAGTTFRSPAT
jgi:hypothetical protein